MTLTQLKRAFSLKDIQVVVVIDEKDDTLLRLFFFPTRSWKRKGDLVIGKRVVQSPSCTGKTPQELIRAALPYLQEEGVVIEVFDVINYPESPERITYKYDMENEKVVRSEAEVMDYGEHK